jgi:hypothetical protein
MRRWRLVISIRNRVSIAATTIKTGGDAMSVLLTALGSLAVIWVLVLVFAPLLGSDH